MNELQEIDGDVYFNGVEMNEEDFKTENIPTRLADIQSLLKSAQSEVDTLRKQRAELMLVARSRGLSDIKIAESTGLTRERVFNIRKKYEENI